MNLDLVKVQNDELLKIKEKVKDLNLKVLIIDIGYNKEKKIYIKNKIKALNDVGISYELKEFSLNSKEEEIIDLINKANNDKSITGIMLELPIEKFDKNKIINTINPKKDIDGLTYLNKGMLEVNTNCLIPCTSKAVMRVLKLLNVNLEGKNVVIINRSELVGIPLIFLMLKENASVRVLHSFIKDIKSYTKNADIIVTAVGKKNFITKDLVKKNAIVLDVGITKTKDGIFGDVDYSNVSKKAFVTKVPNGIGRLTVLEFVNNIYEAYLMQNKKD